MTRTSAIWTNDGSEIVEGTNRLMALVRLEVGYLDLHEFSHRRPSILLVFPVLLLQMARLCEVK
jgi:hypothetical protein